MPKLVHRLLEHVLTFTQARVLVIPHEFGVEGEDEASSALVSQRIRPSGESVPTRVATE